MLIDCLQSVKEAIRNIAKISTIVHQECIKNQVDYMWTSHYD